MKRSAIKMIAGISALAILSSVSATAVDLNMDGILDIQDAIAWNQLS